MCYLLAQKRFIHVQQEQLQWKVYLRKELLQKNLYDQYELVYMGNYIHLIEIMNV